MYQGSKLVLPSLDSSIRICIIDFNALAGMTLSIPYDIQIKQTDDLFINPAEKQPFKPYFDGCKLWSIHTRRDSDLQVRSQVRTWWPAFRTKLGSGESYWKTVEKSRIQHR